MLKLFPSLRRSEPVHAHIPQVEAAIEYVGHKWVILIRNKGQRDWVSHRSRSLRVEVRNHLNEVVKTLHAIETFESQQAAKLFLDETIPHHKLVTRSAREIAEFLNAALLPVA